MTGRIFSAWKQPIVGSETFCVNPGFNGIASLFGDFELNRGARLLLNNLGSTSDLAAHA
jgi:hypothetical protein